MTPEEADRLRVLRENRASLKRVIHDLQKELVDIESQILKQPVDDHSMDGIDPDLLIVIKKIDGKL